MNWLLTVVLVSLAGGVGAVFRYVTDRVINNWSKSDCPLGTFVINLVGSFLLGLLLSANQTGTLSLVLSLGFLGGYTTFSTAMLDVVELLYEKKYLAAAIHGPGMVVLCVSAALFGMSFN